MSGQSVETESATRCRRPGSFLLIKKPPAGTLLIVTTKISDPSVSIRPALIERGIAVSSFPLAGDAARKGGVALPETVTLNEDVRLLEVPFSEAVAVMLREKTPPVCWGGKNVRPDNWAGLKLHVPLPLLIPADRLDPAGILPITIDKVSDPSVSDSRAVISRGMEVSSVPIAD